MRRGADLVGHATFKHQVQAEAGALAAAAGMGQRIVVRERRFDVERDPIEQRQDFRQPRGIDTGGVQADAKTEVARVGDGVGQRPLGSGFAAAEHDGIEQALAAREKDRDLGPAVFTLATRRPQVGVVTIRAAPGAALAEDHGRELPRKIDRGERHEAAHREIDMGVVVSRHHAQKARRAPRQSAADPRARFVCPG